MSPDGKNANFRSTVEFATKFISIIRKERGFRDSLAICLNVYECFPLVR